MNYPIPFLIGLFAEFGFAFQEELEIVFPEVSNLVLETILPNGHCQASHTDVLRDQGQNTF